LRGVDTAIRIIEAEVKDVPEINSARSLTTIARATVTICTAKGASAEAGG
jgi:hypothetical protein